jgi:hypothetical protein
MLSVVDHICEEGVGVILELLGFGRAAEQAHADHEARRGRDFATDLRYYAAREVADEHGDGA